MAWKYFKLIIIYNIYAVRFETYLDSKVTMHHMDDHNSSDLVVLTYMQACIELQYYAPVTDIGWLFALRPRIQISKAL